MSAPTENQPGTQMIVVADEQGTIHALAQLASTQASDGAPTSFHFAPGPGEIVRAVSVPRELQQQGAEYLDLQEIIRTYRLDLYGQGDRLVRI